LQKIKDAEEHLIDLKTPCSGNKSLRIKILCTMIAIHTNFIILYCAAPMPNIVVKFRNIYTVLKIDFPENPI